MLGGLIRNVVLITADVLCVCGVWLLSVLGYYLCGGGFTPGFYWRMWPIVPIYICINALFRLYHGRLFYPGAPFEPVEEMRRLVASSVMVHAGVLAFLALTRQTTEGYSRLVIALSGMIIAVLAQPIRDVFRMVLAKLKLGRIQAVVVGSGTAAQHVIDILKGDSHVGFEPAGYFSDSTQPLKGIPFLGGIREVVPFSRQRNVKVLIVCEDERLFRCQLRDFTEWFTHIEYLPTASVFPVLGSRTVSFSGIGGVEMVNQDCMRILCLEKWLIDHGIALLAFVLSLPLIFVLSVLVKLTSSGPVFYRQERLGKNGVPIRVWKFRTMYADADVRLASILSSDARAAEEWKRSFKLRNDPRVTPLGRFLRKTSLDEIPQLFNVLSGSMALVGPRPIVSEEVTYYGDSYAIFSSVKPGVTGLWQVSGRSDTDYPRRVALDVEYVLNWSVWMDIWILLRTVFAVLMMRGAR